MTPERQPFAPPQPANGSTPGNAAPVPRPRPGWIQRIASVLFIVFCLELGLFLLIYPWTDSWTGNFFSSALPVAMGPFKLRQGWHDLWTTGYLRGAVSGLGLVNIWVAVTEALRMYIGSEDDAS
jgi:hypothetical protein